MDDRRPTGYGLPSTRYFSKRYLPMAREDTIPQVDSGSSRRGIRLAGGAFHRNEYCSVFQHVVSCSLLEVNGEGRFLFVDGVGDVLDPVGLGCSHLLAPGVAASEFDACSKARSVLFLSPGNNKQPVC